MSIKKTWSDYKGQRDGDYFTDTATVLFVPTSAGAIGYDAVRQFLSTAYDSRKVNLKEKVLYQSISEDSVTEESETTITFLTGEAGWIVPGVDARHTIDTTIVIPTVTIANFEQDRISSIRVYWDQASALKQLRLIGDKNSWPIVAERQSHAVRDIGSAHLNPFGKTGHAAGVPRNTTNLGGTETGRRNIHTSSRVLMPGGTGGKSSVFGDAIEEPTNRRFNQNKNTSQFTFGDDHQDRQAPVTTQRRMHPGAGRSQIDMSHDDHSDNVSNSGRRKDNGQGDQPQQPPHQSNIRTTSRVLAPPGGGGSQINFG